MSAEIVSGVKNLIERRARGIEELNISWFGGEPLLASDIVLDVSNFAQAVAKRNGLRFQSSITTNGVFLTEKLFTALVDSGVSGFQITLDGPKEIHDAVRIGPGHSATFDRIFRALEFIKDSTARCEVMLRVHFTHKSAEHCEQFAVALGEKFGKDERFSFHFKAIEPLGGPRDTEIFKLSFREKAALRERMEAAAGLAKEPPDKNVLSICYAAKPNSFVIRSNGTLAKCTVAFSSPNNSVGILRSDGSISVDSDKMLFWMRGLDSELSYDLSCPWFSYGSADAT